MISTLIWALAAVGLFTWNHFQGDRMFIGLRFTDQLLGFPLNAGWLAVGLTGYCLVRWLVRRRRAARKA